MNEQEQKRNVNIQAIGVEMRLAIALFLTLFSLQASGQGFYPWMEKAYKQDNPNELAYFVSVESDCPITEAEAVTILEGTFVRSRIKPLGNSAWMFRELYLSVVLTCLPLKGQNPVYSIDVRFGVPFPEYAMHYAVDYGVIGIGPKSMAKSGLQDSVERAVQVTESDCWRRSGSGPVADILKNARYTIGFNCIRP